uniref:Putative diacylglycerol kinase 5-like isoform X1 n=1 Tax=Davidia involucrata TaxID=16924 RepID=A0A5B7BN14_DAVIN
MAVELAEFLRKKFSNLVKEAEENDPSGLLLNSRFQSIIKDCTTKMTISSSTASVNREFLYDLIDALSECRVFAYQHKAALNKRLLLFNLFAEWRFTRKMKTRLSGIQDKFTSLDVGIDSNPPRFFPLERQTYRPHNASEIKGLDEQANTIEQLLLRRTEFTAIGIVGMGGAGKTALAQKVFTSPVVRGSFEPMIWVCLSETLINKQEDLRVNVVKYILEALEDDVDELTSDLGIVELLGRLNSKLLDKRYLIVLDDVWHINEWYADLGFRLPEGGRIGDQFSHGLPKKSGGVVIVTSRLEQVARKMVGGKYLVRLKSPLSNDICWDVFTDSVKEDRIVNDGHHILEKMREEIIRKCGGLPLAAKTLAKIIPLQIPDLESNRFLREFCIPDHILVPDKNVETNLHMPKCPVLVFIGGSPEEKLLDTFRSLLNKNQVFNFNLSEDNEVLPKIYENLKKLKLDGDGFASEIQKRLRIIIVGGDVNAKYLLGTICDLRLPESPSIVTTCLGSENHIPISFGWEKHYLNADSQSVTSFLDEVMKAKKIKTDSWHIIGRMQVNRPIASPVPQTDLQNKESGSGFHQRFWNYFSMGTEAQRWRAAAFSSSWTIGKIANVRIMKWDQDLEDLTIRQSIRSIVCCNLPGSPAALNPRGVPNVKKKQDRDLTPSYIDDGLLEVIGFEDGTLKGHGIRLAQVRRIIFKFEKGSVEHVKMKIDGEELKQSLPKDGVFQIEISRSNQVNMLATSDCQAKSIRDYNTYGDDGTEEDTE